MTYRSRPDIYSFWTRVVRITLNYPRPPPLNLNLRIVILNLSVLFLCHLAMVVEVDLEMLGEVEVKRRSGSLTVMMKTLNLMTVNQWKTLISFHKDMILKLAKVWLVDLCHCYDVGLIWRYFGVHYCVIVCSAVCLCVHTNLSLSTVCCVSSKTLDMLLHLDLIVVSSLCVLFCSDAWWCILL